MLEYLLKKFGYKTLYFVSYIGQGGLYGSMNLTVKPYLSLDNYKEAIAEINRLAGAQVSVTCISKL